MYDRLLVAMISSVFREIEKRPLMNMKNYILEFLGIYSS